MEFTFQIQEKKKLAVLTLNGSLLEQSQALELMDEVKVLFASGITQLLVDLKDMEQLSNKGLEVLLTILTKARIAGGDMVLCNLNDNIKDVFSGNKIKSVFTVVTTNDEAVALVAAV